MWIDTYQTSSRPWDLNSIISTVIVHSNAAKKENFFDAPNSNFPLLNWLDIIVHRIESICTDRPMSRLHIFVLENWHVQLLYRPTYQFGRKLLRNKVVFQSLLYVRKFWTLISFNIFSIQKMMQKPSYPAWIQL